MGAGLHSKTGKISYKNWKKSKTTIIYRYNWLHRNPKEHIVKFLEKIIRVFGM